MSQNKKKSTWFIIAGILIAGILCACTALGGIAVYMYAFPATTTAGGEPAGQPGIGLPVWPTPAGAQAPDSQPVGLYEGLASLNSYKLIIRTVFMGPTAQDYNETIYTSSYNQEGEQLYSRMEVTSSSADEPTRSTNVIEEYRLGQTYCQRNISSDGETDSEVSDASTSQQSMTDSLFNLFDLVPVTREAQFIGAETVNGIPCNHFMFTVSGLGSTTGAEVTQSSGQYWVAQDGQYIVKYQVTLETRSGPAEDSSADVTHVEMQIDVSEINTPITIQMPADCVR